jgi:rare lipoprotein A
MLVAALAAAACERAQYTPPPHTSDAARDVATWPAAAATVPTTPPAAAPPTAAPQVDAIPPATTPAPSARALGPPPEFTKPRRKPDQRGRASYYHDSLAGNRTAGGDIYDPRAMTAAHRKLAFGTIVDVVRPNGRFVRVRINDRGPFAGHKRIIDLSRIAAERLGMIRAGVVDVALYVIERPAPQ